jgi:hypothetical protein
MRATRKLSPLRSLLTSLTKCMHVFHTECFRLPVWTLETSFKLGNQPDHFIGVEKFAVDALRERYRHRKRRRRGNRILGRVTRVPQLRNGNVFSSSIRNSFFSSVRTTRIILPSALLWRYAQFRWLLLVSSPLLSQ